MGARCTWSSPLCDFINQDFSRAILKGADLDNLSAKKIRRMLEEEFETDLTSRKAEIDALVMRLVTETTNGREDDDDDDDDDDDQNSAESDKEEDEDEESDESPVSSPKKRKAEPAPKVKAKAAPKAKAKPPAKVKPPAKKAKAATPPEVASDEDEDSENDTDGKGVDDESLAKKLQAEEINLRRRPAKKATKPRKQPAEKKERKGTSMYSRPCQLSAELAAVMGTDKMSRHDVVKKMWEIVRERNLQDPKNKQFMLCDDELQKVFCRKRVRMFGMMKTLKNHIRDVRDLTA